MISIITAYYNRKKLFIETLKSIAKSTYKDFEFIVVDDASCKEERIEDLKVDFPFLKVIRIETKNKWYVNPCVPFNIGIKKAIGDIIVLQNPECIHVHDVLKYMAKTVNDKNYITLSAYSVDEMITKHIPDLVNVGNLLTYFKLLPQQYVTNYVGWYNHSVYAPTHFHFCAGITKKNMDILKGFDESYADGLGYDDAEFVYRIKKLGLKMRINNKVSVIHQWHPKVYDVHKDGYRQLYVKNRNLFERMKKEKISNGV